jgi:hypothetical protein
MTPEAWGVLLANLLVALITLAGTLTAYLQAKKATEAGGHAKDAADKAREAGEANALGIKEVHIIVNSQKSLMLERIDQLEKKVLSLSGSMGVPTAVRQEDAVNTIMRTDEAAKKAGAP